HVEESAAAGQQRGAQRVGDVELCRGMPATAVPELAVPDPTGFAAVAGDPGNIAAVVLDIGVALVLQVEEQLGCEFQLAAVDCCFPARLKDQCIDAAGSEFAL